jgi:hypothetical protein
MKLMRKINVLLLSGALFFASSCSKDESDMVGARLDSADSMTPGPGGQGNAGLVTAGEWNDLDNWSFWKGLLAKSEYAGHLANWGIFPEIRIAVQVTDLQNASLVDIPVELIDQSQQVLWKGHTDHNGKAELWPSLYAQQQNPDLNNLQLRVNQQVIGAASPLKEFTNGVNQVQINMQSPVPGKVIDVAFVVDATSSMSDEIQFLQSDLQNVITRVKASHTDAQINLGAVFYRDHGDDYLTRISGFSTNEQQTLDFIDQQAAAGGGDFPEAVDEALQTSVNNLNWSANATSRILFLVLDAPPHNTSQNLASIKQALTKAGQKGIKIIPLRPAA